MTVKNVQLDIAYTRITEDVSTSISLCQLGSKLWCRCSLIRKDLLVSSQIQNECDELRQRCAQLLSQLESSKEKHLAAVEAAEGRGKAVAAGAFRKLSQLHDPLVKGMYTASTVPEFSCKLAEAQIQCMLQ